MIREMFDRRARGNVFECMRVMAPLVAAMAASAVNQFVDRLFLSQYSDEAIEGSLPGGMLGWLFICLVMCTISYSGTFVSQYKGAGKRRAAVHAFAQGVWLSMAAAPVFLALIPAGVWCFNFFGHAPEVVRAEADYYSVMMVGAPLNVLAAVCGGYFSGMGKTRITGVAAAAGNAANILLDWLFIFGKCGLPEGGIAGAAWASNLATLVTCAVYAFAISRDKTFRACGPLGGVFAFDWPLVKRIVRFGAPSGFQVALDCFTFTVFVMMTGRLDAMSLAVSNVVFTVNHLSFAPLMGMNQAASVLAGNYMGAKDTASATRAGASCLVVGWLYFALFALFVALCGERMIDAFHGGEASAFDPAQFRALGMALMWILVSWGFFDATDLVLSGALKGAGDTRFVMCAFAIVSFCMWMPAFLAVMKITPGIIPLWLTMPAYCAVCATIITTRWMRGKWKMLKLI